ncbi:MAG: DNA repair protein RecO [Pseudomonadota bacterium]
MQSWDDEAIVLGVRPHGEGGAILNVLTPHYGAHAGYIHGLSKLREQGGLDLGASGRVYWQARLKDQMGSFRFEADRGVAASILHDRVRLTALQSACHLCHEVLPERHANRALFDGLMQLLVALPQPTWAISYIVWELALLREVGFALDLSRCAVLGTEGNIAYVSPKTGRGVSVKGAGDLAPRLLPLPEFLKSDPDLSRAGEAADIAMGLDLTGYFLDKWVFVHHHKGIPASRLRLAELCALKEGHGDEIERPA